MASHEFPPPPEAFPPPAGGTADILFIAGEHSGDEHAARIATELLRRRPGLRISALGGPALQAAGAQLLYDMTRFSAVGLVEVLVHYPFYRKLEQRALEWIRAHPPRLLCLVDYPGLNLRLADKLRAARLTRPGGGAIPVCYYISPQIWAWKSARRFKMARTLDTLGAIFPFEPDCYADTTLPVRYVGHPFATPPLHPAFHYDRDAPVLLLPGSRPKAVRKIFPILLQAWANFLETKTTPPAAAQSGTQSGTGGSPVSPQPAQTPQSPPTRSPMECGTSVPLLAGTLVPCPVKTPEKNAAVSPSPSLSSAFSDALGRETEVFALPRGEAPTTPVAKRAGTIGTKVPHSETLPAAAAAPLTASAANPASAVRNTGETPVPLPARTALVIHPGDPVETLLRDQLARLPRAIADTIQLLPRDAPAPIAAAAALGSSGTMSLKIALAGIPGAIVYRANPLTWWLGRRLVKGVEYLGIANILLRRPAWPEYLQGDANPAALAARLHACLTDPEIPLATQDAAARLHELLAPPPAGGTPADWLLEHLPESTPA